MKVIIETASNIYQPVVMVSKKLLFTLGYKPGQYLLVKSSSGKTVVLAPRIASTLRPDTILVSPIVAGILGIRNTDIGEVKPVYIEKPGEIIVEVTTINPPVNKNKLVEIVGKTLVNKVVPTNKKITIKQGDHTLSLRVLVSNRKQTLVFITRDTSIKIRSIYKTNNYLNNNTYTDNLSRRKEEDLQDKIREEIALNIRRIGFTVDTNTVIRTIDGKQLKLDIRALKNTTGILFEIWIICSRVLDEARTSDIMAVKNMIDKAVKKPNLVIVVAKNAVEEVVKLSRNIGILLYLTKTDRATPTEIASMITARITTIFKELLGTTNTDHEQGLFRKITLLFKPKTSYAST